MVKTALNYSGPWCESPFALSILDDKLANKEITKFEFSQLSRFIRYGFVTIDLELTNEFISDYKKEILNKINTNLTTQQSGYHYSNSPRLFEAWKDCATVLDLCKNNKILNFLKLAYNRQPIPFQTINFIKGSNQPLHSDTIHFHTIPERWTTGVWVALEDMDENNGTLQYVPRSHRLPAYTFQDLNLPVPKYGEEFENYHIYEQFLEDLVRAEKLNTNILKCKAGTALVWAANLLYGGIPIVDNNRTRHSQAIHYYYEGCETYYCPLYSDKYKGDWSLKDLSKKDILNHKI